MTVIFVVNVWDHPDESKAFSTHAEAKCYLFEIYKTHFESWYGEAFRDGEDGEDICSYVWQDLDDMLNDDRLDGYASITTMELVEG